MEKKHIIELILYIFSTKTLFPHISHCTQKNLEIIFSQKKTAYFKNVELWSNNILYEVAIKKEKGLENGGGECVGTYLPIALCAFFLIICR